VRDVEFSYGSIKGGAFVWSVHSAQVFLHGRRNETDVPAMLWLGLGLLTRHHGLKYIYPGWRCGIRLLTWLSRAGAEKKGPPMATWWLWICLAVRLALFSAAIMATAMAASPSATEREIVWHLKLMAATALWLAWSLWVGLVPETPQQEHREPTVIMEARLS